MLINALVRVGGRSALARQARFQSPVASCAWCLHGSRIQAPLARCQRVLLVVVWWISCYLCISNGMLNTVAEASILSLSKDVGRSRMDRQATVLVLSLSKGFRFVQQVPDHYRKLINSSQNISPQTP